MDDARLAAIQAWVESNGDAKGVLAAEIDTEAFLLAQVGVLRADNQRLREQIEAVKKLHVGEYHGVTLQRCHWCMCPWPCPTWLAVSDGD